MRAEIAPAALRRLGSAPVRIDWYGNVTRIHRQGTDIPYVALACSRVGESQPKPRLTVHVPAALLRLVRIGDVWQSGVRIDAGHLPRVTFSGLVIRDDASIVPCGSSVRGADGGDHHELPFDVFDAHRLFTRAFVVCIDTGPSQVLIVPSMELIRFYFGSSGMLLANVFSGAFAEERLYERATLNPSTGVANITLASNLPGVAATTVARIAFDKVARRQLKRIVNSGIAAAANREGWFPRVGFPFEGTTDLTAEGVWIERATDRAFVVHRLLSCTHPFPFEKLYYRCATVLSTMAAAKGATRSNGSAASADHVRVSDVPVDAALSPAVIQASETAGGDVPFPDLTSKLVRRVSITTDQAGGARRRNGGNGETPVELGVDGRQAGGARAAHVSGPGDLDALPLTAPHSLLRLVEAARRVVPSTKLRAPWGKGAVNRAEWRAADGRERGVWAACLDFGEGDAGPIDSILGIAAEQEQGAAEAAVELMLFAVEAGELISEDRCLQMGTMFWVDAQQRELIGERHALLSSWSCAAMVGDEGKALADAVFNHLFGLPYPGNEDAAE